VTEGVGVVLLGWAAGEPDVVSYDVYRSTVSPVAIIPGNLVANVGTPGFVDDDPTLTLGVEYFYAVQANDATGPGAASEIAATPNIVRINAGGSEIAPLGGDTGPAWAADNPGHPFLTNTSSSSVGGSAITTLHSSATALGYVPLALYTRERYDGSAAGGLMTYTIPVASGSTVDVNLFMGNGYNGGSAVGFRQFNVYIEAIQVLNTFDVIVEYGHQFGGVETFTATDSDLDGYITIEFERISGKDAPVINAIEVRPNTP
jgi:hypothetical protein